MKNLAEMETNTMRSPRTSRHWLWRFALAATVLIGIGLLLLLGSNSKSGAAWALEKTIEAYRSVRFIHMKCEPISFGDGSELWAQFDEQGNLMSLRTDVLDSADGPKVIIEQADKSEIWFKKKNSVAVQHEPNVLQKLKMSINDFDPRRMVENIFEKESQGKAEIKPVETGTKSGILRLSVTYQDKPNRREIYDLNTATQLVTRMEKYRTKDGKEEMLCRTYYLDYNNPEIAAVFKIDAPADVIRIDQTAQDVGLVKGNLSDNEMAIKVAREFFEALIAGDYDQAGRICGGVPGTALKKLLNEKKNFLRIVSVDVPQPKPNSQTEGFQVPCKIEIEANGAKAIQDFDIGVRPVYNRPDRWNVFGGFSE